ncbi:MAG: arsenite methyltransferase [Anaerolineae bacterium]
MQPTSVHDSVREHYAERARNSNSCCGSNTLYDDQLLKDLPTDITTFSLGCGNPITTAALKPGETVLDLGSGGGLDCFLASKAVGEAGHVIGVDMTPDMLAKARGSADRLGYPNVEFREGYLEALPVTDATVDVVMSNCVINLSPDKSQVFREVARVLKPNGRIAVSDIVTNGPLPEAVQKSMAAWGACVAGALQVQDYARGLIDAGLVDVRVTPKDTTDKWLAALPIGVPFSATITARKPQVDERTSDKMPDESEVELAGVSALKIDGLDELIGRVVNLDSIENGYDLRLEGDLADIRAKVAEVQRSIGCCSPLKFELIEAADGTHLHVTNPPASAFVSLDSLN